MLLQSIKEEYPNKSNAFYEQAFEICMFYCIKLNTAFEFQSKMRKLISIDSEYVTCKDFRYALTECSYFTLNLKMFVFEYYSQSLSLEKDREAVKKCVQKYALKKADFIYFLTFYSKPRNRKLIVRVFKKYKYQKMHTIQEIKNRFHKHHDSILKYCKFLSYRKLTFIIASNNMSYEDMNNELMCKAVKSYYALLPTDKDEKYVLNYIKRAVHNHAMNIIQRFKFLKRDRLQGVVQNGEYVYTLQTVSENQLTVQTDDGDCDTTSIVNGVDCHNHYDNIDVDRSINKVLTLYTDKKQKLLKLVFGEYDDDFTQFLHKIKRFKKYSDNVSLYYSDIDEYKNQACHFLSIRRETCDRFLKHVYAKHM